MPFTINNPVTEVGVNNTPSQTIAGYTVGARTNAAGKLFVYAVVEDFSSLAVEVDSVTFDGVALSPVASVSSDNTQFGFVFELNEADIGAGARTGDIVVNYNQDCFNTNVMAFWVDDIDQSAAIQITTANIVASSTSISTTLTGVSQGSLLLSFGGSGSTALISPDGNQTEIDSQGGQSSALAAGYEIVDTAGDYTQGYTYSSGLRTTIIILEYAPLGAATPISVVAGTAVETDTVLPAVVVKPISVVAGTAVETDTVLPAVVVKPISVVAGTAVETDTVLPAVAVKPISVVAGTAVETDTVLPAVAVKPISVVAGTAVETDTVLPAVVVKPISVVAGTAVETDTVLPITRVPVIYPAISADSALVVTPRSNSAVVVNLAEESSQALPVPVVKPIFIQVALAAETSTTSPVTPSKPIVTPLGLVVTTDTCFTISPAANNQQIVGTAVETDTSGSIGVVKPIQLVVGTAVETDTASQVSSAANQSVLVGVCEEQSQVLSLSAARGVSVETCEEQDQAISLVLPIIVEVGVVSEVSSGLFISLANSGILSTAVNDNQSIITIGALNSSKQIVVDVVNFSQ